MTAGERLYQVYARDLPELPLWLSVPFVERQRWERVAVEAGMLAERERVEAFDAGVREGFDDAASALDDFVEYNPEGSIVADALRAARPAPLAI